MATIDHKADAAPGITATRPTQMPRAALKEIALRTWREAGDDNIGLVAAGVAFYGFLAIVPLLGAIVLSYGIVADPATVMRNMEQLTSVMPADAAKLIGEQLLNVVNASADKKGLGILLALGIALFGARNGAGAVITALNIAYEEREARSFVRLNLVALTITAGAVIAAMAALFAVAALGYLEELFPLPDWLAVIAKIASYMILAGMAAAGAATLYRFGPSRSKAQWIWLTPGSIFTAILWLLLTFGFGLYVANFGNYDATYGSLGTVVVLLTWLYLSSYILLFGAELNSEFEHQTAADTTDGVAEPIGERGAWVADHVAAGQGRDTLSEQGDDERTVPGTPPASVPKTLVQVRLSSAIGRRAGFGKVGFATSALASFGLARLRRGGAVKQGIAALVAAGLLSWLLSDTVVERETQL